MDSVNAVVQIIQTVGFPIVVAIAAGIFIKYMYDKGREDLKDQRERYNEMLADERTRHADEEQRITEALNNNTVALTKLAALLDKEGVQ